MLSAKEFYDSHIGKSYDVDGSYGAQCVDAFKLFTLEQYGISNYNCTNGYASGLWIYRKQKPYYQYFTEVSTSNLQNGDWVFWNNASKECPDSHVAMYYDGKFFSQNQNGKRYFTLVNISHDGILGVLRPKIYESSQEEFINIPPTIEKRNIYKIDTKEQFNVIKPSKFGGLSYRIYNYVDNKYFAEIETIDYGKVLIRITDMTPITSQPTYTHGNY